MSKISPLIKEAKIINSEYSKPEKRFDDKTGEFKCFNFDIFPTLSKKNTKNEWETKGMSFRCTIWNEKLADKFMSIFDANVKNYITVLDGQLSNFHIEQIQKISNNGTNYSLNAYSYLGLNVNDFIITQRHIDEQNGAIKQDNKVVAEPDLDDEIPF